ncbi:MAG: hypothetical protein IID44_06980 [Planctomycetes bacterium]|nr:hypothetical protein [Planctomycetota bacterium]
MLAEWWNRSLVEGLRNVKVGDPQFEFRMVFWADLLYANPQHQCENFSFDSLYNSEPYHAAKQGELKEYEDSWLDVARGAVQDVLGSSIDSLRRHFGVDSISDWFLGKLVRDLAFYYDEQQLIGDRSDPPVRRRARDVLLDELKTEIKQQHALGKQILLIAHSMGSIIAYDALRDIGREKGNTVEVQHFVTIGSPLGLPLVKGHIDSERQYAAAEGHTVRTPSIVRGQWTNYADRKDPVALDMHLRDDFGPNKHGIRVEDDLVANDYHTMVKKQVEKGKPPEEERKNNHHKSYGYLRTPELSRLVKTFLGS